MTPKKRKNTMRYSFLRIFSCFIIPYSLFTVIFIWKYPQAPICLPTNPANEVVDRQDEWKYQNSITGEWYYWRTVHKKQNNDAEWRVKWLNTEPTSSLGVIVYLTKRNELGLLKNSLDQLSRLLTNNPRPVVIFHEGDFNDNDTQQSLAKTLGSRTPLAFERIQFFNSSKGPWLVPHRSASNYLDMCRFFTLMLPNHPLLTLFTFYWRLDAHSYIFGPKTIEDPFEIMQKRQIQYAFTMANEEDEIYTTELWSFFHKFLNHHCLKPSAALTQTQTNPSGRYSLAIFFTNFAIANVSLFRDHSLMRAWLHAVDRNGSIYRHRWGDAPVHTLGLTQFLERDQIVRFRSFGYMHRREYVCPIGMEGFQCRVHLGPILRNYRVQHSNIKDGCQPVLNPLCHYYPKMIL